ncbi:MAG: sulfotransferase [Chloroflexi bacterium]|nr:MAG: sulfotransferase [Chloroflexota bacterium]MBL1192853.1 sulfotransferase [Chloroflexota bacterium]NOH10146.1 sulfotransferase [Chloroflexota bacterium]
MLTRIQRRLTRTLRTLFTGHAEPLTLRAIPSISKEEVAEAREFFPLDKFFIFGHARSGTTLLARLVRVHPEVHCNWQAHFFTRPPLLAGLAQDERIEAWLARRSNRWNRGRDLTPVALRAMADYILERDARREGAKVVGDKSPNVLTNGEAVKHMHSIYPDSKLIYIVRDGRDTLISHRFQNFIDGPQFLPPEDLRIRDDFARNPDPYFTGQKSLFTSKAFERMASGWVKNIEETDGKGKELYGEQYLSLRYEDLLNDPFDEISKVWAFLAVDPQGQQEAVSAEMSSNPDAAWQKEKAGELVANLEKGKRGSWRDLFTVQDKQRFKATAGQTLIDWGYEQDMEW